MGYRAEKEKIEKAGKKWRLIGCCTVLTAVLGLCIFNAFCPADTWKYHVKLPKVSSRGDGELRIHFLDVGQGDATLVELPDGKVLLVDGGDGRASTAKYILRYMNALDIDVIDHLVVTHADADHCGSLDAVLDMKKVLNAYLPAIKPENTGQEYKEFYAKLLEEDCTKQYAARNVSLGNSEYVLSFLYPYSQNANEEYAESVKKDDNALSSMLWLDYKGVSALFTGDAPLATEDILMRDAALGLFENSGVTLTSTEILKVSHHGSEYSTGLAFLQYLQVETAVVSCGAQNLYGHPSKEVQNRIAQAGASLYRTDTQGTVMITVQKSGEYAVDFIK